MNETGARRLGFRTSRELALHTLVFVAAFDASAGWTSTVKAAHPGSPQGHRRLRYMFDQVHVPSWVMDTFSSLFEDEAWSNFSIGSMEAAAGPIMKSTGKRIPQSITCSIAESRIALCVADHTTLAAAQEDLL